MTDSSQTRLAYIAEATYGVTPANPVFQNMRFTGESLKPDFNYISSQEIRPDRNIPDMTLVGMNAGGGVDIEMSYGSFDTLLEALLGGTWSSNILKNGVTERSFTLEKTFETGATDQFHRFPGSKVNTLDLSLGVEQAVTGGFGFLSKQMTSGQAIITGATYTAAGTTPVMNASTGFASLTMTGVTAPEILKLDLNITNNMRQQPVMGQIGSRGIGTGRFTVTGSMDLYFKNAEVIDLLIGNTSTDLAFDIGGVSSQKYNFKLGKMKFSNGETLAGGNDTDILMRLPFQAIYNSSDLATLVVTRTP